MYLVILVILVLVIVIYMFNMGEEHFGPIFQFPYYQYLYYPMWPYNRQIWIQPYGKVNYRGPVIW